LLSEFLVRNKSFLGKHEKFPFLLKVMAIGKPLPLQCFPNAVQAKKGYEGEAEILYAISACTLMCGFRPKQEIEANLKRLLPRSFETFLGGCSKHENPIRCYFEQLYRLGKQELKLLISEYLENLSIEPVENRAPFLGAREIALQIASESPDDPNLFAPYLLNIVELEPGQAIYLEPCLVHAYVHGNSLALTNNSDTTLCSAATDKSADVEDLMRVMVAKRHLVETIDSYADEAGLHFVTENPNFDLSLLSEGTFTIDGGSISLLFCLNGFAEVSGDGHHIGLERGECLLVGPSVRDYQVKVDGTVCNAYAPEIV
ncbi:MAG TPA: mannose-6-phosphate isomerase, class I, partial [Sphaerochaeta sp.]|nr:mannose-6-phosphate isomerase, class I [Sphaerochaeta sp.]